MKARSTILTCYLALMAFSNTLGQVVSNFEIDSSSGCAPLSVSFTNKSTGTGTLTYSWEFGNGNTSTLKDPKAVYSTAGNYTVKLTVSDGTNSSSASKSIVVFKNPVANFTANAKGCVPINISFKDASVKGDATINKWNWDFRNGVLSSEINPVNSYTSAGKYDVFLEVTDANGCKSSTDKKAFVDVAEKPMVGFYATPSTSCTIPADVVFTNQSSGGGTLTYLWDFGGGSTSTEKNPRKTYNSFGTFNVKLTVSSEYGCSSTLDVPSVVIGEVKAQGSLKQGATTISDKSIVCTGDIDYSNSSAGNSNCFWDFGDGSYSYSASGKHQYFTAGNYVIKLVAAPGDACADTTSWNITVEKAVAEFSMLPEKSCNASNTITLTNQSSSNIVAYKWRFHDGSVLTNKDVTKTYKQPADSDAYVIHEPFSYPVRLTVTSTNGCKDSIEKVFSVQQPTALFSASKKIEGCAPLKVKFKNISTSDDPIDDKVWKFGEGADRITKVDTTSYTYNTPGNYDVKLIVQTKSGCKDTSYVLTIRVGSPVVPDFSIQTPIISSSEKIQFTYLSPAGVSRWHYFIDGVSIPSCPDVPNPSFYMKTDTGSLDVKLIVDNNGCLSEVTKPDAVKNDGPVGSFDYSVDCSDERKVIFTGKGKKTTSVKWDFGDSQTATTTDAVHFYATEGNYTVKFIAYNGARSDTTIRIVKVRDHQPSFTFNPETCSGNNVYFNSKLSHKLYESCSEKYLWTFGDLSQPIRTHIDSVPHVFAKGGLYPVKLYAFYEDGCVDSVEHSIRVYQPIPGFTVDKSEGCAPLPVTFTDTSTPDVHSINFWSWDFSDDNMPLSYTNKVNTLDYIFGNPGEYNVTLTISDDFGCTATFEKKIATAVPTAYFSAIGPTQICSDTEVEFLMDYPDPDKAIWNFGNGHTLESIAKPVKYLYTDTGSFDVTLTVYKYGCSEIFTYNKYIQVQKADARFSASDTVYNCFPRLINLVHTSGKNNIQNGKWYYGHGNNTSSGYLQSSSYNYPEPGNYTARLEVQTSFGCADTFQRAIKITGPTGRFNVSRKEACQGDEVTFALADTANVHSFEWDLGDGNSSTSNPVKHRYNSVGKKGAKLILYGDIGKCKPPAIEDTVLIYEVTAGISVTDTSVCEGTTIDFANTSLGASVYNWNFGDGAVSTTKLTSHLFAPGTYKVSLMTEGLHGCKDTAVQYVVVTKIPSLSVSTDTTICVGAAAMLRAVSDKTITWSPVEDLSSATVPNPAATPKQDIRYIVYATDPVSQCFKKDSVLITVQQVPVIEVDIEATNVIAGRPVQITATTEPDATFEWSPADFLSCADCFNPITTARVNTSYLLKVTDKNKCFTVEKTFDLKVEKGEKAFDVPSAFTPSGTEPNNIFRVQGYNVKQLLEFKIYNRWGNLVFSSTDLSQGWDGTYQGKAQPVDSYVYTIKIETFDGNTETKTGTILLLR